MLWTVVSRGVLASVGPCIAYSFIVGDDAVVLLLLKYATCMISRVLLYICDMEQQKRGTYVPYCCRHYDTL